MERARKHFVSSDEKGAELEKASEWFLDNYYLVRRVARQVVEDLPPVFAQRLPELGDTSGEALPRIEALARSLVARGGVEIDLGAFQMFLEGYQSVNPLTIAELWALPTMLRIAVLEQLLTFLRRLGISTAWPASETPTSEAPDGNVSEAAAGVERAIRALRILGEIDWKVFFEKTSRVEVILKRDPAKVYGRMEFETCDAYRKSVEDLAWVTGAAEWAVAEQAVALAQGNLPDPCSGHVGYYLLNRGRRLLEERIGYRPTGMARLRRLLIDWPTSGYLGALATTTLGLVLALAWLLRRAGTSPGLALVSVLVAIVPLSVVATMLVQRELARFLPPASLPKLDFAKGIPDGIRALVVIPTLLGRREDVEAMLRQIELHFLSNPDPQLEFALLTDEVDAKVMPGPSELLESVARGIMALNAIHGGGRPGRFHLLHRTPRWNPSEERFMGWERKRGKLEELNRLLRGSTDTSFTRHVGDPSGLLGVDYVITADSDTQLPIGTARRLVGMLAHPLNRAVFDEASGRVISGYTIVQPRVEMSPSSARQTLFARIFAGDLGFDIYTHAVSESYQDLFGAGIYVGKGIYDVDAFMRSVEGRAPENSLASHDLFEGIQGRTALATDIVLFEEYPSQYAAHARRMHRWVRGDWQLLPWLFEGGPAGAEAVGHLATIDRWKILDNLRRSLVGPLLFAFLLLGLLVLPGSPLAWTLGSLAVLVFPIAPAVIGERRRRALNLGRGLLTITFLPHQAVVIVDAVARVMVRMTITRKHMLQWTSAAHTAFGLGSGRSRFALWREMMASPILAVALGIVLARVRPSALLVAAPLLVLWFLAPEVARQVSKPAELAEEPLSAEERQKLRMLARRTWRFFDVFVGPNDQWLPIDNHQEEPALQTAHRTSPTNIGMMLLSTLAAHDLGFLGASEVSLRVRSAFDSIARMEHYQGHLLNWYDTKSLQPLLPRYVSTVDSGNLAGCLIALKKGCADVANTPVLRVATWDGLRDSLDLLTEAVESVPEPVSRALRAVMARLRRGLGEGAANPDEGYASLQALCDETSPELDRELLALLETGAIRHDPDILGALRTSTDHFHQQLRQMRQDIDTLLPWLLLKHEESMASATRPTGVRLSDVPEVAKKQRAEVRKWESERRSRGELSAPGEASARRVETALDAASARATTLLDDLRELSRRAEVEVRGMDFRLLYDRDRRLLRIGYNATQDQLDGHYYDLLASEARLASYIAIVKGDIPGSHWAMLGRPMIQVAGAPMLLSWGGTMFEYLMPSLLMRSREGTLLAQTCELVVEAQIAYGAKTGDPWGVSESAYARFDVAQTYQYRSFGVPGLGFKRGLEGDRVVAPYASVLAASLKPRAVLANLKRLAGMGMVGTYGMFEALDLRPDRATDGAPSSVVRSYMAHHQGMLLVALDNLLNDQVMVERFHADRGVQTGEILLNERAPGKAPPEWPVTADPESIERPAHHASPRTPTPWAPDGQRKPQAFVLSNGRLSSVVTATGRGGLQWQGLEITRYQPGELEGEGRWLYLRDEESGNVWLASSERARTTFSAHKADLHERSEGISAHVSICVAPADDVEVQQVVLHNETDQTRHLTVTSVAEPVLLRVGDMSAHPAFARMFVESESLPELAALFFARRPRASADEQAVLVHRLVSDGPSVILSGYETDRSAFFGRGGDVGAPASLASRAKTFEGRVGAVLDPVVALTASVELKPKGTATLAFVTSVARTRTAAIELARRYGSIHAVRWAMRDAELESPRRLARAGLDVDLLPAVQQLYSGLLFCDRTLRAPRGALEGARPRQPRLWERGISGDDPIVVVRVNDPDAPLLRQMLSAQRYLRSSGVRFDLVLLDEQPSGYLTEVSGTLRSALAKSDAGDWLGKHGGVFVIAADQLRGDDRAHLEACARVVLDVRDGSLATRMARGAEVAPRLPHFEPSLPSEPAPRPLPPVSLAYDNGFGGFAEDGREYVISARPGRPTPAPWCNVLTNPTFGCLVSESSLGATWSINAGENRLTPWRNDPVFDSPSEALYLRDEETAAVWSPTPLPAGGDAETRVRHGMGYTTYTRESHGLIQELTIFVPPDAPLKVARLRLENTLGRHRRLTASYYAEWALGAQREKQRPFIESELEAAHACLLATCTWNADFGDRVAFLASELKMHGFSTDRQEFFGRRGDRARPEALERWGLGGSVDAGGDPCAVMQVHLEIPPGETVQTHFLLGQAASRDEALAYVASFRDPARVESAWKATAAFWGGLVGNIQVRTPEPAMDLLLNQWLLYQSLSSRLFGRTGFYQSSGAFGFRDQLQDILALLHTAPDRARAHIVETARHQFEEGDVLHWWHPPAGRGVRTRCSDDMLWLPFVTAEYVAATGDDSILAESIPFLRAEPLRKDERDRYAGFADAATPASLFEHCRRALERGSTAGAHGLPLMGDGDWNDGMNHIGAAGRGESVWLGWFLCATMARFATVCDRLAKPADAEAWRTRESAMRAAVEASAWDGRWFLRAFHDDGSKVGSAQSRECRIDSIAQSWSVISARQGADGKALVGERERSAVRAADNELVSEADRLVRLLTPPFDTTSHDPGYIRAYPPGIRENGGQYTHGATWLGVAYVALGDGDRAERVFRMLNPILHATSRIEAEHYRVEPYALAGDVYGASPWIGRGGWSWYTGGAGWLWRLGVEGILGLRRRDGALAVNPCIPPRWPGFDAWILSGSARLHVIVENPGATGSGVTRATLDGSPVDWTRIRLAPESTGDHEVRVWLGAAATAGVAS